MRKEAKGAMPHISARNAVTHAALAISSRKSRRDAIFFLKSQVIPESEIDDPFLRSPINIQRVADYRGGMLSFELSASPPPNWIMAFRGLGNYAAVIGSEPQQFVFSGNLASVPISSESAAQIVVNHAKNYVQQANIAYRENAERTQHKQLAQQRANLRKEIAEEERRMRVLNGIRL